MKHLIQLIRIPQWTKNFFVFAPLFFAGEIFNSDKIINSAIGFIVYSLAASAIYILNDYKDIAADKNHPTKKHRPLASGQVSSSVAFAVFFVFLVVSFIGAYLLNVYLFYTILGYVMLNIAYSFGLKHVSLLDIMIIAIGFELRITAGGIATGIVVSQWLYIMTFLLATFLAIAKRRDDVLLQEQSGIAMRKNISAYSIVFINNVISVLCSVLIVSYLLYVTSPEITLHYSGKPMYISALFVLAGILRYLQITLVEQKSGSPTKIVLNDTFIQLTIACWVAFFMFIIYC
jgi:decaprenyl-phosphate phosphoribosyltransferase